MDEFSAIKKQDIIEQKDCKMDFSDLEAQCVLELLQNKPPKKISQDLGLSRNTVNFYLMNAGQKIYTSAKIRSK